MLLPLAALVAKASGLGLSGIWYVATDPRVASALKISFGVSLLAALTASVFGFLVAWVLTRYRFPGRKLVDAVVDLPFALPTAVAGIALARSTRRTAGRRAAGEARHQGRLHAARHLHRPGLHRPAVRGAHRAAGDAEIDQEVEEAAATPGRHAGCRR